MKSFFLLFIVCFMQMASSAQRACTTDAYVKNNFELQSVKTITANSIPSRDTFTNEIITIPVVIHVLFNNSSQNISNEAVLSQLTVLNKDFRLLNADKNLVPEAFKGVMADSRIMFCLAKVDPDGRATSGINRKYTEKSYFMADDAMKFKASGGTDAWNTSEYLNIWVCSLFGQIMGYATPPGGKDNKDGIVINTNVFGTIGAVRKDFNKGRTTTHEVAHWMGLKHIWGDDFCGDDEVSDTPRQLSYNFGCPVFPSTTSCSPFATGDMYMNFMDFTNDACMNMFTQGQKMKMRAVFASKGSRNSFLQSYKCDSTLATGGPLPADTIPVALPADYIKIYPNPVADFVSIHSGQQITLQGKTAKIYTTTGIPVAQQLLQSKDDKINIRHLVPGLYILTIGDGKDKKSFKLVKQ